MSSGAWTNIITGSQPNRGWTYVESSYTGQYCIASSNFDSKLYVSSDYGATWTSPVGSPQAAGWGGVAISQDGTLMAACKGNGSASPLDVYLFVGGSWTTITNATSDSTHPGNSNNWTGIAFSIDKTTLAAVNSNNSYLWLYDIASSTWSNINDGGYSYRFSNLTSNNRGFVTATRSNLIRTIYNDGTSTYTVNTIFPDINGVPVHNSNFPPLPATDSSPGFTSISSTLDGKKFAISAEGNGSQYIYTAVVSTVSNQDYWTFKVETVPGQGNWQKVQFGPGAISIVACSRDNNGTPATGQIWVGTYNGNSYNWNQEKDSNGNNLLGDWMAISRNLDKTALTKFIAVSYNYSTLEKNGIWIFTSTKSAQDTEALFNIPCFKEGTLILTPNGNIPIEKLRRGDLVKTINHGYLSIVMIGKKEIYHTGSQKRIKDQLYRYPSPNHPDLILTGAHSILKSSFKDEDQRAKTVEILGRIFVTDNKYRIPACLDEKAKVYEHPGNYNIYHLALENHDPYMNYGIYANGVLVESCSKRNLQELSYMELL
jgi:hypothetical protein